MARYKPYNQKQDKWIALSYADQLVPGSFEYALNEIVRAATVSLAPMRPAAAPQRGRHHAVVPSSRSTFPRH
jgi:hypothetical protein